MATTPETPTPDVSVFQANTELLLEWLQRTPNIERALDIAQVLHRRQTYGDEPYMNHLLRVALIVQDGGYPQELVVAALLHDAPEDQGLDIKAIAKEFGSYCAEVIENVTYWKGIETLSKFDKACKLDGSLVVKRADNEVNYQKTLSELETEDFSQKHYDRNVAMRGNLASRKKPQVEEIEQELAVFNRIEEEFGVFIPLGRRAVASASAGLLVPVDAPQRAA
ncbi:MAG TPA: HD domain-containing protein [Candidatus Saccharimonadales bacterium]